MNQLTDLDKPTAPEMPTATDPLTMRAYRLLQDRMIRAWQEVQTADRVARLHRLRDYIERRFIRETARASTAEEKEVYAMIGNPKAEAMPVEYGGEG